jgi:prolyl 4-hydroxylase
MPIQPLGNQQAIYDEFLSSCVKRFGSKGDRCISNERDRIAMSLRQPQSMTNYTEIGFKKIKAPPELFKLLKEFWKNNKEKAQKEQWGIGNTYTNNWIAPTYMVSVENTNLRGGGPNFKQHLWDLAKDTLQVCLIFETGELLSLLFLKVIDYLKTRNGQVKNLLNVHFMEFVFIRRGQCLPLT